MKMMPLNNSYAQLPDHALLLCCAQGEGKSSFGQRDVANTHYARVTHKEKSITINQIKGNSTSRAAAVRSSLTMLSI